MQKIDLVYLWVDGNDKNWRQEKAKYLAMDGGKDNLPSDATVEARWRDNDELKYALRSAEKYVPWINHIYLVTGFNQVPKWLNTKNPKITIVPHEAIMPPCAIPTFCSDNIEMCMANIPGLSEHFLLSNDDMFFTHPLTPDYFFDSNGRAIFRYNKRHTKRNKIGFSVEGLNDYQQRLILSCERIARIFNFDKAHRFAPSHGIDPYVKSSFLQCRMHPVIKRDIDMQLHDRFRQGYHVQRFLFNLYDKVHNHAVFVRSRHPKQTKNKLWNKIYNFIHRRGINNSPVYCTDALMANLYKHNPPVVCINDSASTTDEMLEHNAAWLKHKFPKKSSFEK